MHDINLGLDVAQVENTLFPFMSMEMVDALKESRDNIASAGISPAQAEYINSVQLVVDQSGIIGPVGDQGTREITATILLNELGLVTSDDRTRVSQAIGGADLMQVAELYSEALARMPDPALALNVKTLYDLSSKGILGPASVNNISNTILNQNEETTDKRDKRGFIPDSVMGEFAGKDRMTASNLGSIDY